MALLGGLGRSAVVVVVGWGGGLGETSFAILRDKARPSDSFGGLVAWLGGRERSAVVVLPVWSWLVRMRHWGCCVAART